jgi:hypothetical protein
MLIENLFELQCAKHAGLMPPAIKGGQLLDFAILRPVSYQCKTAFGFGLRLLYVKVFPWDGDFNAPYAITFACGHQWRQFIRFVPYQAVICHTQ